MYSKFLSIIFLILMSWSSVSAQIDKMREKLNDVMIENDEGLLSLRFFDAETGDPVGHATVKITDIGEFTTDGLGMIRFPIPEKDGIYAVYVECDNYISVDFPIEIVVQTIFYNRFSLSKKMPLGHIRIVLEWDKRPSDLDAHFEKEGNYHISYRNTVVSDDNTARLDRDDRDGYGPETITLKNIDERNTYRFYVHNYSNKDRSKSKKLSRSKATIKVYGDDKLLEFFQIPVNTEGIYWQVFSISNGHINRINNIRGKLEI